MDKKIYFVTEGIVDKEAIHSERFNQIVNPDTEETIFEGAVYSDMPPGKDKSDIKMIVAKITKQKFLELEGLRRQLDDSDNTILCKCPECCGYVM